MGSPSFLSIVIPVYNEEENIPHLIPRLQKELVQFQYELIFVDDGSNDQTVSAIKQQNDPNIKTIVLNRNFGQTAAMSAGIDSANGKYIVTMDGDLQNDPEDVSKMIAVLEEGNWDVVAGRRLKRKDNQLFRKIPSKLANALIRKLTGVYINDYGCTLKIFKKDVAKNLGLYGQLHRFIPVLAQIQGARITEIPVKHHPRIFGKSKYGLGRTLKVISDLALILFLQKYIQRPMHLFGPAGIISFIIGIIINFYLIFEKLAGHDIWGRPLLISGVIFLLSGIQLLSIGFLAEMITRTYYESQNKTTYLIREKYIGNQLV